MPPVAKAGGSAFRKDVDFVAKDDDEQVAAGIVMVPDKADLQNDFAREETIREFADQFGTFVEAGEAGGGIMHAVWPDDWMTLERNEVLDESESVGGETVDAGAWVQEWSIEDSELWALIDDGILEGYSIGAIQVDWNGPFEQDADEVNDVAVPDALGDDMIWELTDGLIREVSAVDIPAVPDAEILETKADAEKRLGDYLGDRAGFVDEALERGHTEAEAERLWDVLNDAVEAEGSGEPGKQSALAKAGQAFLSALTPGSGSDDDQTSEAPDRTAKAGQTLSQSNRDAAMAAVDANLDMLHDAGMDVPKRFTDRDDVDFDIAEHDGRDWAGEHGDGEDGDEDDDGETEASATKDAAGGDTPAGDGSTDAAADMSDTDEDTGEDKSLAEKNAEQINELTDAVKGLADAVESDGNDPDGDKTAEVELPDGSVAEVSKSETEEWFDDDGDGDNTTEAAATKADIEALHARLDAITRESAGSQQLEQSDDGDNDSGLDGIGKALS